MCKKKYGFEIHALTLATNFPIEILPNRKVVHTIPIDTLANS